MMVGKCLLRRSRWGTTETVSIAVSRSLRARTVGILSSMLLLFKNGNTTACMNSWTSRSCEELACKKNGRGEKRIIVVAHEVLWQSGILLDIHD